MAGGVGIEGNNIALPAGASCPSRPLPLPPSPQVEKGNPDEPTCRGPTLPISGPSLSTKWRGTEGEASEGRTPQKARKYVALATPPSHSSPDSAAGPHPHPGGRR